MASPNIPFNSPPPPEEYLKVVKSIRTETEEIARLQLELSAEYKRSGDFARILMDRQLHQKQEVARQDRLSYDLAVENSKLALADSTIQSSLTSAIAANNAAVSVSVKKQTGDLVQKLTLEKESTKEALDSGKARYDDALRLHKLQQKMYKFQTENLIKNERNVAILKQTDKITSQIGDGYSRIKDLVVDISQGGLSSWLAILVLSFERFIELDKAAGEFRKKTGLMVSQMGNIAKNARELNIEYAGFGIGITETLKASAELQSVFQTTVLVTKSMTGQVALLTSNIGVVAEDAARIFQLFGSLSKSAGTTAEEVSSIAVGLAESAGVAPRQVFEDIAKASSETLVFLGKNPIELMRTAIAARRAGTSIDSMSKSARGFLNFQDSITAEMEASALTGKSINFQLSRQLAFEGDIEGSRNAALRQLKQMGDFSKMNAYQQEALAKASGMTVTEIIAQQNQEKQLQALRQSGTDEDIAAINEYEAANLRLKNGQKETDLMKGRALVKERQRQTTMENINNSLKEALLAISDSLLPIANTLMPTILDISQAIAWTFSTIGKGIKYIAWTFSTIGKGIKYISDLFPDMKRAGDESVPIWMRVAKAFALIGGSILLFSKMSSVGGGLFGKLLGGSSGGVGGLTKTITSVTGSIGKGFKSMMKSIASGIGYFGKPDVLRGAAAMIIMAGSLWILSKALTEFSKSNIADVGIMAASLAVGLVAMVASAAVVDGLSEILIPATIIIGAFGLSMLAVAGSVWIGVKALEALTNLNFSKMTVPFSDLGKSAPGLFLAAGGIIAVGEAMALFGAGNAISSIVGKLTGGNGMVSQMITLSSIGPGLNQTADALTKISVALEKIKGIGEVNVGYISKVVSSASDSSSTSGGGKVEEKLDAILEALTSGKVSVYLDGRLVSKGLAGV
jgi:hypothetical protein